MRNDFSNGKLIKDVYMAQPDGFIDPKDLNRVCKLKRSIYGLKQAYHIESFLSRKSQRVKIL